MTVDGIRQYVTQILGEQMPLRGFVHSVNYVMERIRARGNWSFWEKEGNIALVDEYDTGTIAVTNGTALVTGSGVTWTSAMVGRQIRIGNAQYNIQSLGGSTFTLDTNYVGTDTSGMNYSVYQSRFSLGTDVDKIVGLWNVDDQRRYRVTPPVQLNTQQVWRPGTSDFLARDITTFGRDSSNNYYLWFDPAPTSKARVVYWYHRLPTAVSGPGSTPDIPNGLHLMLAQGVLAHHARNNRLPEWRDQQGEFKDMMEEAWDRDRPLQLSIQLERADCYSDAARILETRREELITL